MPSIVTGHANHADRQKEFGNGMVGISKLATVQVTDDFEKALIKNGAAPEDLAKKGLTFIRKKSKRGALYFVTNLGDTFQKGWVKLNKAEIVAKFDPIRGESLMTHRTTKNGNEVYLILPPGKSCFLREAADGAEFPNDNIKENELVIQGNWKLTFIKGKPSLPAPAKLKTLNSWTLLPDSAEFFSGTARYEIKFNIPPNVIDRTNVYTLQLGDVREVASVKINGKDIGTAWCIPYELYIPPAVLKSKDNVMEIEVTNLSANYMRLRDQRSPEWKKFYDINIVDITYKKFDASRWQPMPSGLLGPIKLIY